MNLLHTMLRVGDLQQSIDFYTKILGMTLLDQPAPTARALDHHHRAITVGLLALVTMFAFEAVAVTGEGVFDTLKAISKLVLKTLS